MEAKLADKEEKIQKVREEVERIHERRRQNEQDLKDEYEANLRAVESRAHKQEEDVNDRIGRIQTAMMQVQDKYYTEKGDFEARLARLREEARKPEEAGGQAQ